MCKKRIHITAVDFESLNNSITKAKCQISIKDKKKDIKKIFLLLVFDFIALGIGIN